MRTQKVILAVVSSLSLLVAMARAQVVKQSSGDLTASRHFEYLWYEAENMSGAAVDARNEPRTNPSWMELTRAQAPGWGMNGPGVSAEWRSEERRVGKECRLRWSPYR